MKQWIHAKYLEILQKLCRREMAGISNKYPHSREELIKYYDMMMIQCVNQETVAQEMVLGISISTASCLEDTGKRREIYED